MIHPMVQDNRKDPYKPLSFSNYKKTDLCSILERSIIERQLEAACHWTVEIHCSGWIDTYGINSFGDSAFDGVKGTTP